MLNENQIQALPERIYQRLNRISNEYLEQIGKVIKDIGELRPSDVHKIQRIYKNGENVNKIEEKLAKVSEKNIQEIYDIFDAVAKENYSYTRPFYKAKDKPFIPYNENKALQDYVKSIAKVTVDEYVNLSQNTAFAIFSDKQCKTIAPLFESNKNKVATSLSKTYTSVIDYAVIKVQLGGDGYQTAMREVIKALAKSGIRSIDYATGYSRRLDTVVRQNLLFAIKQCNQNIADMVGEEFGADGYEVSYHSNPRPEHAEMGGKRYAKGKARTINGVHYPSFSTVEHLLEDFGCLHFKFSILLGISRPAYSPEQLAEYKANDNRTFEFEGKKYTGYEATQMQKKLETAIWSQKDLANIAKAAGDDELRIQAQEKINQLTNKYAQFSDAAGLPTYVERMRVDGFRSVKVIDKSLKDDIINILPRADEAKIPSQKFTEYALNPSKDENKAKAFKEALGYTSENVYELIENIRANINKFNAVEKADNGYGKRYEILMTLTGANGKKANVKTAWIVDKNTGETRLTSAYVTKKKIKE